MHAGLRRAALRDRLFFIAAHEGSEPAPIAGLRTIDIAVYMALRRQPVYRQIVFSEE